MKKSFTYLLLIIVIGISSCNTSRLAKSSLHDDGKLELVFVQVNDVYEIAPLAGGTVGGMARVATLKKEYLAKNPNTLLVIAGDFLSPSVYNSLKYQGKRIRGAQMVDAMNTAGMNMAIFGNHEFDISEAELQDRINESHFQWISTNSFHKIGNAALPFNKVNSSGSQAIPETYIMNVKDADGTTARIGFIAITLPFNKAPFVTYTDPMHAAVDAYNKIKDSCDAVVAITHQSVEDDIRLANTLPKLAVIIGGHEHDMRFEKVGNVYITKAHANAKSAYIIKLEINKKRNIVKIPKPTLRYIGQDMLLDSATNVVVKKWGDIAEQNYASLGFDARKVILSSGEPLEGRETEVRTKSTNLSKLVVNAMAYACPDADVDLLNAGSIRVDDILPLPITEYDIIRSLPFGGAIRKADMKGRLLTRILDAGKMNNGIGGFLQYNDYVIFNTSTNAWSIKNLPIDPEKVYKVAMPEFLLTGGEANMDFLKTDNPDIIKAYDIVTAVNSPESDVRLAVVKYLESK